MAKLAPRRIAPMTTLKQLSHIKIHAPHCLICGERVYSLTNNLHIGRDKCATLNTRQHSSSFMYNIVSQEQPNDD